MMLTCETEVRVRRHCIVRPISIYVRISYVGCQLTVPSLHLSVHKSRDVRIRAGAMRSHPESKIRLKWKWAFFHFAFVQLISSYGSGFIFTTALPPDKAAAALTSVEILKAEEGRELRKRHQESVGYVRNQLLRRGFPVEYAPSHIIPVSVSVFSSNYFTSVLINSSPCMQLDKYRAI